MYDSFEIMTDVLKDKYIKALQEQITLLKEMDELNKQLIESKDKEIKDLYTKLDETLVLANRAISLLK